MRHGTKSAPEVGVQHITRALQERMVRLVFTLKYDMMRKELLMKRSMSSDTHMFYLMTACFSVYV